MPGAALVAQATDVCANQSRPCEWIRDTLGWDWLAGLTDTVVAPLGAALVVLTVTLVVSVVARVLVRRAGRRLVARKRRQLRSPFDEIAPKLGLEPDPRRQRRTESLVAVVSSIVTVLVWTVGVLIALGTFDIEIGPLIASAGIVGIALGFGAQSLVADFLSGIFMLAEDQFGIGDVVDLGEAIGVVESISLRTTQVRAVDGTLWHVPNGQITRVGNMSQDWARAVLDISVAYDTDIARARQVIEDVARELAQDPDFDQVVLEDAEILGVQDLAADAVLIRVSIKTLPGEQWTVARAFRQRIKEAFDAADISIPFPQRQLWIRSDGAAFGDRGDGDLAVGASEGDDADQVS